MVQFVVEGKLIGSSVIWINEWFIILISVKRVLVKCPIHLNCLLFFKSNSTVRTANPT